MLYSCPNDKNTTFSALWFKMALFAIFEMKSGHLEAFLEPLSKPEN